MPNTPGRTLAMLACVVMASSHTFGRDWILSIEADGKNIEGEAVHWNRSDFYVLGRDGKLWEFDIERAPQATMKKRSFQPFTHMELRGSLMRDYGTAYDVSGTGHFLVVHPVGQRDIWASRFEQLYREMVHYFTSRGIRLQQPKFPLVAVVFPTKSEFYRHANQDGMTASGVLGYYCTMSNRIMLYDESNGRGDLNWRETAATVVHEAAHQTAFNTGIHGRWSSTPLWICEGLGTMFEARGINNSSKYPQLADRVNQRHLSSFSQYFPDGVTSAAIKSLVVSDETFQRSPLSSYALSWALTFMFAEQQPAKLAQYLSVTAGKPGFFANVPPSERLRDFQRVFGADFDMLAARLSRFVAELN